MKKKLRKFSEGGFETAMGKNPMVDEDLRSRAMRSVEGLEGIKGTDIADEMGTVKGSIKRNEYGDLYNSEMKAPKTNVAVAPPIKPIMDMSAEKARMEELTKKQALIPVHPEDYIPGAGMLKPLLRKVAEMGAKRTAKEVAAKNVMRKAEEGFNPKEALEKINPTKVHNVAGRKIPVKRTARKTKSTEGIADDGGSGAFKRGGRISKADMKKAGFYDKDKTKSERQAIVSKVTTKPQRVAMVEKAFSSKNMKAGGMASRRADGCAIRGKTRA